MALATCEKHRRFSAKCSDCRNAVRNTPQSTAATEKVLAETAPKASSVFRKAKHGLRFTPCKDKNCDVCYKTEPGVIK